MSDIHAAVITEIRRPGSCYLHTLHMSNQLKYKAFVPVKPRRRVEADPYAAARIAVLRAWTKRACMMLVRFDHIELVGI
jgi:hypothetical protein